MSGNGRINPTVEESPSSTTLDFQKIYHSARKIFLFCPESVGHKIVLAKRAPK